VFGSGRELKISPVGGAPNAIMSDALGVNDKEIADRLQISYVC
jgi:hypothetical protein